MKKRPSTGEIKYVPFWTKMPVLAIIRIAVIIVVGALSKARQGTVKVLIKVVLC